MISPGAVVCVRQFGAALWIVKRPASGGRWYVSGKSTDQYGRNVHRGHLAGAGDIVVIREAPTYPVGAKVQHMGQTCTVIADRGDELVLATQDKSRLTRGGDHVRLPAGEMTISKADLNLLEDTT